MLRKKLLAVFCLMLALALSLTAVVVFAQPSYGAGEMESVPAFAEGHEQNLSDQVTQAASSLGAAQGYLTLAVNDGDRVLLQQDFESGSVFMNEAGGIAFAVTDSDLLTKWENEGTPQGVILGGVVTSGTDSYLLTDTVVLKKDSANAVTEYDYAVGELPADYSGRVEAARLTDRFADAYKFAVNYNAGEFSLGIPTGAVEAKKYTTRDLQVNGKYAESGASSEKTYYVQAFEGGYIMQARLDQSPHYAAAAISSDMYEKVTQIADNSALNVTGAPVSRQFTVDGVIYQNFEYGYVKVEDGAASFVLDRAVSPSGTEVSRIIASFEDNWHSDYNVANLHIQDEQVRMSEQVLAAVGDYIDETGKTANDFFDIARTAISHPMHEFAGKGSMLKMFSDSCGDAVGGNNLFVICGNWYDGAHIIDNSDFTPNGAYFTEGENKVDENGLGFPLGNATTFRNVKYQEFTLGVIYQVDGSDSYACVKGAAYAALGEKYGSIEDALLGEGVAETESNTYKAMTYTERGTSVEIWYDSEESAFTVSGELYAEWKGANATFAEACAENGNPVYAEESDGTGYLITTKYVYTLSEGSVTRGDGLGTLSDTTANFFGSAGYTAEAQAVITDGFADAYQMAYSRNGHLLGKATGAAAEKSYVDTEGDGSTVYYLEQKFENGVILQSSYNSPAVAIFGNVVTAVEERGGYSKTGLPIARQYTYEGVTYCNFTYGYLTIDAEDTAEFVYDKAVGTKGNEIDRNIGRFESRANVTIGGADFGHELLRMYEAYVAEYERVTDTGFRLFTGSVAAGHEWNAIGVTQSYIAGSSTSTAWGQQKLTVMVMSDPFGKAYIVRNAILDKYAMLGGNNEAGNYGMPVSDDFTVSLSVKDTSGADVKVDVTFQNFERGVIYSYVNGDTVSVASVEDAVAGSDGTVLGSDGQPVELEITIGTEPDEPDEPSGPDGPSDPSDPSDPSEPEEPEDDNTGLIVGLVIAGVVVVAGVIVAVVLIRKKNKKN